jgi:hypothetical protein
MVLETNSRGPFLLAELPSGRYDVEVVAGGNRTEGATVDVVRGQLTRIFLTFPSTQP